MSALAGVAAKAEFVQLHANSMPIQIWEAIDALRSGTSTLY